MVGALENALVHLFYQKLFILLFDTCCQFFFTATKTVSRNSHQMMDVSQSENSHLGEQKAI